MFTISDDKARLQLEDIQRMLSQSYWAKDRTMDVIAASVEHSLCFGAYLDGGGRQIGFARAITDYATTYYLCDVIVDEAYRGRGVGAALVEAAVNDARLRDLRGILATRDAHALYERYGFRPNDGRLMGKPISR